MAFKSGNPGRPIGSKNKMTGAHKDLLNAWDKVSGPETALELMRKAVEEAKKGNSAFLVALLPYIARKMPEVRENYDMGEAEDMPESELDAALKAEENGRGSTNSTQAGEVKALTQ